MGATAPAPACPRCAEALPEQDQGNFCTACGWDLRAPQPAVLPLPPPVVRLTTCPACAARNAASRSVCGRCQQPLGGGQTPEAPGERSPEPSRAAALRPAALGPAAALEPADEPDSSRLLLAVTLLAGAVILAVLFTLLRARGVDGPPVNTVAVAPIRRLEIAAATSSSVLPPAGSVTYDAGNVLDRDPRTAWTEGAEGATGQWLELRLRAMANISRLVIWNGYQKDDQFLQNGRVRQLLIAAGGRRFTVELLNVAGPQPIDLPQPVRARTIRLQVQAVYEGTRYSDTAISEIEVLGTSAETS